LCYAFALLATLCFSGARPRPCRAEAPTSDTRQPNIVLILADDVGREVLGCYGGESYKTPNIDRLAADGVRLTHAYAMAVCHPTRICLLTGQYPCRLGNPMWGSFPAEAEQRTVAQVLKGAGYATAVVGKWQLAMLGEDLDQPHRLGFDQYCLYGWHEGPWYYHPFIWQNGRRRDDVAARYGPDVISDYLLDFITRNQNRPFFAYYSMSLSHSETNDLEHPAPVGPHGRYDNFAEMVVKMDDRVGRLVDHLESLGLRDNTLIVYLADNGTAARSLIDAEGDEYVYETIVSRLGDREITGGKATLTDWGTRVPFIVNWPGKIPPGDVSDMLVDVSDILPTLADAASAPLPSNVKLDGYSILPSLVHSQSPQRPWAFAEHYEHCFVRTGRWKLYEDGRLYDTATDPDELAPIAEDAPSKEAIAARKQLQQAMDALPIRKTPRSE